MHGIRNLSWIVLCVGPLRNNVQEEKRNCGFHKKKLLHFKTWWLIKKKIQNKTQNNLSKKLLKLSENTQKQEVWSAHWNNSYALWNFKIKGPEKCCTSLMKGWLQ